MKIDTTKIEGFDAMSAEDKVKALQDYEYEASVEDKDVKSLQDTISKLKDSVSKANKESAENKRKFLETLSESERKEQERIEADAQLKAELDALRKEKTVNGYTKQLMGLGIEGSLAEKMANELPTGIGEQFFAGFKKFKEDFEKNLRAEITKETPKPDHKGSPNSTPTKEDFDKMNYQERVKLYNESPELYKEFTN